MDKQIRFVSRAFNLYNGDFGNFRLNLAWKLLWSLREISNNSILQIRVILDLICSWTPYSWFLNPWNIGVSKSWSASVSIKNVQYLYVSMYIQWLQEVLQKKFACESILRSRSYLMFFILYEADFFQKICIVGVMLVCLCFLDTSRFYLELWALILVIASFFYFCNLKVCIFFLPVFFYYFKVSFGLHGFGLFCIGLLVCVFFVGLVTFSCHLKRKNWFCSVSSCRFWCKSSKFFYWRQFHKAFFSFVHLLIVGWSLFTRTSS